MTSTYTRMGSFRSGPTSRDRNVAPLGRRSHSQSSLQSRQRGAAPPWGIGGMRGTGVQVKEARGHDSCRGDDAQSLRHDLSVVDARGSAVDHDRLTGNEDVAHIGPAGAEDHGGVGIVKGDEVRGVQVDGDEICLLAHLDGADPVRKAHGERSLDGGGTDDIASG